MAIRAMTTADLSAVVAVHSSAFPGFFLTRMGPHFLRFYYQFCLDFEHGICQVHTSDSGDVEGFVVGFAKPELFYTEFSRRRKDMLIPILRGVLNNPMTLGRLIFHVVRMRNADNYEEDVELSSIGVGVKGRGVGAALLESFLKSVVERGWKSVSLTTDADANDSVNRFYEKNGFTLVRTKNSGGRLMNVFTKDVG